MSETGRSQNFIADAKHHNGWWSDETSQSLSRAIALTPRSDFYNIFKITSNKREDGAENLTYSIFGQTGIGKTTLLHQFIAALLNTIDFPDNNQNISLESSVSPRQVLYVPLEESLYHLEHPDKGIKPLERVIDYFKTHVAPRQGPKYIFIDDVNALNITEDKKSALLDIVDDETHLFLTGIVAEQTTLSGLSGADKIDEIIGPIPILPMKFVDAIKTEGVLGTEFDGDFGTQIESYQSTGLPGNSPIKTIRDGLKLSNSETSIETAVETLDELHFDILDSAVRDNLHDAARDYLRQNGALHHEHDATVRNELAKSHFLLFLYKELSKYASIQNPENLHRISSIAASHAGEEIQYTKISDQIGVDRRTVDSYLDVLDEGIAVTESHDFSLRRYRRTRLYLRNPRHLVLLSQRQEHYGFEDYAQQNVLNHEFEYKLARTVAFDHAKRLAYYVGAYDVEYTETETGLIDYILHRNGQVLPFIFSYHPHTDATEQIATEFDPNVGQHTKRDSEELHDFNYEAPYRFIITDSLPQSATENQSLYLERGDINLCYLPYWLFLLIS